MPKPPGSGFTVVPRGVAAAFIVAMLAAGACSSTASAQERAGQEFLAAWAKGDLAAAASTTTGGHWSTRSPPSPSGSSRSW
jgi:hypothetical protein